MSFRVDSLGLDGVDPAARVDLDLGDGPVGVNVAAVGEDGAAVASVGAVLDGVAVDLARDGVDGEAVGDDPGREGRGRKGQDNGERQEGLHLEGGLMKSIRMMFG